MHDTDITTPPSLEGWDIRHGADVAWVEWGPDRDARAKVLGAADGYVLALIEAEAGYRGAPHEHAFPEFLFVVAGEVENQRVVMKAGDGYAAATGSVHTHFSAPTGASYLIAFKV